MHASSRLAELARRHGVGVDYWSWGGEHLAADEQTLVAVLAALGVPAATPEQVEASLLAEEEAPWRRTLPPVTVLRAGSGGVLAVHVPHGEPVAVELELEGGERRALGQLDLWVDPRPIDGALVGRASFRLPDDLPTGWHRLLARVGAQAPEDAEGTALEAQAPLVVTPQRAAEDHHRSWGLMAQLYQLRSQRTWGIGDLGSLTELAGWARRHGADFVLVNPLHAPAPVLPIEPSPYLPTSRRFIDPGVIEVSWAAQAAGLDEEARAEIAAIALPAQQRNGSELIDRDAAWLAKRAALELIRRADQEQDDRHRAFGRYVETEGQGLLDFATWCALAEEHGADWHVWPEGYRRPDGPEVAAYRLEHDDRIDFYRWLQWVVNEQLARVHGEAVAAGHRYGIIHDLAVGVHPSGADAWALPEALARGVSVGAPPDQFNQLGQDWSQPPWRPDRLAELGYAPYRDMLRGILRHAGGVRIDHILGLFRLWWIPHGNAADRGAYVRYDHEALIGILLLEAQRAGAVVIGEDLGVVEDLTRETMRERHIAGTSILWFEWDDEGRPLSPDAYREACLATVTTHDLPPTAGYLEFEHLVNRERLGLLTRPIAEEREYELGVIAKVVDRLREAGLVGPEPSRRGVVLALHRYLAGSRARALGVSVADLAGDRRSVNQPGTYREYPNWRVPLAGPDGSVLLLEELLASPLAAELAAVAVRPRSVRTPEALR